MIGFKTCSKCGLTKPLSAFYKSRKTENVYLSACKECYAFKRNVTDRRYRPRGKAHGRISRRASTGVIHTLPRQVRHLVSKEASYL